MKETDKPGDEDKELQELAKLEKLLANLMLEVKQLRAQNAEVLQRLDEEANVHQRVGVRVEAQQGARLMLLKVPDIAFITTNTIDDTLVVYGADGKRHANFESLDAIERRLGADPRLMRTHRAFLVNLNQIATIDNDGGGRVLTFRGCEEHIMARVAPDNRAEFERRLGIADA